jgi:hypothetical protein
MMWWYKHDDRAHRGTVHRGTVNTVCGLSFRAFRSRVTDPPADQICRGCDGLTPQEHNEWRVLGAVIAGHVTRSDGQFLFCEVPMPADSSGLAADLRGLETLGRITTPAGDGDGAVHTTETGAMRWLMLDQRHANETAVTGPLILPSP